MSAKTTIAGALALLATPIVVIAAVLIQPTLSGDASTQVTALTSLPAFLGAGIGLQVAVAAALLAVFRRRGWLSADAPCRQPGLQTGPM